MKPRVQLKLLNGGLYIEPKLSYQFVNDISKPNWRSWLKLSRIIPLTTVLGAGIANVLALIGILQLTVFENIVIVLLALLSIDSLIERTSILEKIEKRLSYLSVTYSLRTRDEMLKISVQAENASEICLVAVHGTSAIVPNIHFLEKKIQENCRIRIVLLEPESIAVNVWDEIKGDKTTLPYLHSSLEALRRLLQNPESRKNCEVRLLNVFLPYSMVAVDLNKDTGAMTVEYGGYRTTIDGRPHVFITSASDKYWFDYYKKQFETVWTNAKKWNPDGAGRSE